MYVSLSCLTHSQTQTHTEITVEDIVIPADLRFYLIGEQDYLAWMALVYAYLEQKTSGNVERANILLYWIVEDARKTASARNVPCINVRELLDEF